MGLNGLYTGGFPEKVKLHFMAFLRFERKPPVYSPLGPALRENTQQQKQPLVPMIEI